MKIRYSDVYTKTFEPIVDQSRVMATIKAPDKQSYHDLGDRRYELVVKRHKAQGNQYYYVWVLATVEQDDHLVYCALAILESLCEDVQQLSPYEMLEVLLQTYGLVVQSELKAGRLIYDEAFWAETQDPAKVWTVVDKPEHYFLGSWTIVETYGVSSRIESHFVFALDMDRYLAWLKPLKPAPSGQKRRRKRR